MKKLIMGLVFTTLTIPTQAAWMRRAQRKSNHAVPAKVQEAVGKVAAARLKVERRIAATNKAMQPAMLKKARAILARTKTNYKAAAALADQEHKRPQ